MGILVEIVLPAIASRTGWSIQEISRRHGDYAMVGVAANVTLDAQGRCDKASCLVLPSVGDGPVQAQGAMNLLQGEFPTPELITAAAETCATQDIDPTADIHASVAYRSQLAKKLTKRALTAAFGRAAGEHMSSQPDRNQPHLMAAYGGEGWQPCSRSLAGRKRLDLGPFWRQQRVGTAQTGVAPSPWGRIVGIG